jgi:hypothetical protein
MPVGAGIPVAAWSYTKSRKAIHIRKVSTDIAAIMGNIRNSKVDDSGRNTSISRDSSEAG